jgi:DNA repair protein RadD
MMELRPYQKEVIAEFNRTTSRRALIVAPTGSGKTVIAAAIVKHAVTEGKNVLVIAHRREIVQQTCDKLRAHHIPHGIIMAGTVPRPLEAVQVASIQTLVARIGRMEPPPADLLIVDECHHAVASSYRRIMEAYPDAVLLGVTATPCRGDGRGLGGIFETMIQAPQVPDLIEQGHLVKTRVYAPPAPDLRGVRTQAGDYVESQLDERMNTDKLVGDIVTHWHRHSERRKTVCFATSVAHSVHLRDEFINSGVRAEHIDGSTPKTERDATLARLAAGEIELVSNCMVLTEGWDMPEVSCCILARPTKKMGLYRQMIGRVLRPAPGKTDAIILDHSGAVFLHGFVEDRVQWVLSEELRAGNHAHSLRELRGTVLLDCNECGAIREGGKACPNCGWLPQIAPKGIAIDHSRELGLVNRDRSLVGVAYDPVVRRKWLEQLTFIAEERGYARGWTAHKYKEKFGEFPPWGHTARPVEATAEVRAWVRSRQIAYAKARAAS